AAEFAIVAARRPRLAAAAGKEGWAVRYVRRIMASASSRDRYIAIAQLGITLATIGLGMYGEPSVAAWIHGPIERAFGVSEAASHTIGTVLAVLGLTYFHVVVGEMIPKALALQAPERTAIGVARPMRLTGLIFYPLVALLNAVGAGLLRLLRVPEASGSRFYSPSELTHLVHESHEEGAVSEEEERLIRNILDFGERQVRQVMVPRLRVEALPLEVPWNEARRLLAEKRYSRYPVFRDDLDGIVGIVHVKDFIERDLNRNGRDAYAGPVGGDGGEGGNADEPGADGPATDEPAAGERTVGEPTATEQGLRSLVRRVPKVPEAMSVERLLASFKRLHVHMAIVVDEHGGTSGIVTLDDLLEEVVGEVGSEPERIELPEVEPQGDGSYLVDGNMQLYRFNERFETRLESSESTTVAGFVLERLKRVPRPDDETTANGWLLRVEKLDGLAIRRLLVMKPDRGAGHERDA
ncbi:MAG: hemolysin family protein, partial [Trueperaceae bacterium]